ncbi:hypothetical protein HDV02_001880 [Globomyces sp. JEL0801]|nr:hypothetical protein HDV02_001880 [Globomyces sp. JEL0801]
MGKRINKSLLDVYDAQDNGDQSKKLLARRGGGGGHDGRNLDWNVDNFDFDIDNIDSDDDEEISEDGAFNEEDEERYGLFFTNNKFKKPVEESEQEESFDEDDDDEFMDISEMLNDEPKPVVAKTTKQSTKETSKKFSLLLPKENDLSASESDAIVEEFSDEDESGDDQVDVSGLIDKLGTKESLNKKRKRLQERTEAFEESEYMPSKAELTGRKKLALTDLVGVVAEETGFGELKSQLGILRKHAAAPISVPLVPRMQEKLNRAAAREETEKDVSKWNPIVRQNRQAEQLSFPMNPFNDMEIEINNMLEQSGLTEKKLKETEELELKKLSKAEVIERQQHLAKMRSLMFFKEQKQKQIAKIKSKTYRKIANKAAEKNKMSLEELHQLDPDLARQEKEKLEFDRAKERMTLKHKNTSKWAKRMIGRQREEGTEGQKALLNQLKRGEQLKRKIEGFDSDESEYNATDDEENALGDGINHLKKLEEDIQESEEPTKGIFAMKFMKKGLEQQKKESALAIEEAKREIQSYENGDYTLTEPETKVNTHGRHVFNQSQKIRPKVTNQVSDVSEFQDTQEFNVKSSGSLNIHTNTSQPLFQVESFDDDAEISKSKSISSHNVNKIKIAEVPEVQEIPKESLETEDVIVKEITKPKKIKKSKLRKQMEKKEEPVETNDVENPWLIGDGSTAVKKSIVVSHKSHERMGKSEKSLAKLLNEKKKVLTSNDAEEDEEWIVQAPAVESNVDGNETQTKKQKKKAKKTKNVNGDDEIAHVDDLDTMDIMQMAFANDDVGKDFQIEKEKLAKIETGVVEESVLPGWGGWSGPGMNQKPKVKKVKKSGGVALSKRKDKNLQNVIINEKRQKKVSKYYQKQLPHGFDNATQYERTMNTPLGKEWNTPSSFNSLVKPKIVTRMGAVIHPLKYTSKPK